MAEGWGTNRPPPRFKVAGKRLAMGLGRLDKYTLLNSASFTPQRSSGSRQVAKLRRHSGDMFGTQSVICGALFRHCHNFAANHSNHIQIFTCQANSHDSCILLLVNCKTSIEACGVATDFRVGGRGHDLKTYLPTHPKYFVSPQF